MSTYYGSEGWSLDAGDGEGRGEAAREEVHSRREHTPTRWKQRVSWKKSRWAGQAKPDEEWYRGSAKRTEGYLSGK